MRSPSDQTPALSSQTPPSVDSDYDSIHAAVMETVRGRWFLSEYARRNRHADTDVLLKAIGRIESFIEDQVQDRPEPIPSENNDNQPVSAAAAAPASTAEPFFAPKDKLEAANAELVLIREHIRHVTDSLIECGAPSFLTNDLKRRVEDISRVCVHLGDVTKAAQPVPDDVVVVEETSAPDVSVGEMPVQDISDPVVPVDEHPVQEALIEEAFVAEASVEIASHPDASVYDASLQEISAEEMSVQETAAFAEQDDIFDVVAAPEPPRDPFADLRALSAAEKIALFT